MAGGNRKNAPKTGNRSPVLNKDSTTTSSFTYPYNDITQPTPTDVSLLLPEDSIFTFELLVFHYSLTALLLQHLILYHSVWWLPDTRNSMKFYLIDSNVIQFSSLIIGRRVIWLSIKSCIGVFVPGNWKESVIIVARSITSFFILTTLLVLADSIVTYHPLVNILYLAYPLPVYFLVFGLAGEPFLELFPKQCSSKALYGLLKGVNCNSVNFMPASPEATRSDVSALKADFNMRRKQTLFNSIISTYYSAYIPCCFTPRSLNYDLEWIGRHIFLVWMGLFSLYAFRCFPASYNHRMHCLSQRLGLWTKIEGRLSANFYSRWSPSSEWKIGQIVRYGKDLYRAEGPTNVAEPGNVAQTKFYKIFKNPNVYLFALLLLHLILLGAQYMTLLLCDYWYQLLPVSILLFANFYMLFKLCRNYFVLDHIYGKFTFFPK